MIKAGIDLGAGSIRVVTEDDGVVFDEASMIAIDEKGNCLAYGNEALEMKGVAIRRFACCLQCRMAGWILSCWENCLTSCSTS